MEHRPVIALVGRPNVGKSALFNRLVGRRVAIVQDEPGVTRDRIHGECEWRGRTATVIDTGGIDMRQEDGIPAQSRHQAAIAMAAADVIVLVVDGREGLTALDEDVAEMLRRQAKPVFIAVNKVDNPALTGQQEIYEFYQLGLGEPIGVSAEHGRNVGELLDKVYEALPESSGQEVGDEPIRVALIGRPNVGKSSLVNALVGEERSIVSDTPGTTRDVIDIRIEREGTSFVLLDTAGMRRRSRVDSSVEHYSVVRAVQAIERCDVAVVVLDGTEPLAEQDKRVIGLAHEAGKAIVIVVNKWDLVDKTAKTMGEYERRFRQELHFVHYAPFLFISALTGQRVERVLSMAERVVDNAALRVSTGAFNDVLRDAVSFRPPPSDKGVQPKIFYGFQAGVKPPTFVLFCSYPDRLHFSYVRYLENRVRERFSFHGTPIRFHLRDRRKK